MSIFVEDIAMKPWWVWRREFEIVELEFRKAVSIHGSIYIFAISRLKAK